MSRAIARYARASAVVAVGGLGLSAGDIQRAIASSESGIVAAVVFNSVAFVWVAIPALIIASIQVSNRTLQVELIRSGSWSARRGAQAKRHSITVLLIAVPSVGVWVLLDLVVGGPIRVEVLAALCIQLLLLVGTCIAVALTMSTALDLGGRPLAGIVGGLLWVWLWASERGVIAPLSPWSASRYFDLRVSGSGLDAVGAVAGLIAVLAALLIAGQWKDRRLTDGPPRSSLSIFILGPAVLFASAVFSANPSDRSFWLVGAGLLGPPQNGPIPLILTTVFTVALPWYVQMDLSSGGGASSMPARLRFGSDAAWLRRSLRKWVLPTFAYIGGISGGSVAGYLAGGGRDFSPPPSGWGVFVGLYLLIASTAIFTCIALIHLVTAFSRRELAGLASIVALIILSQLLSMAAPWAPKLTVDLSASTDVRSWQVSGSLSLVVLVLVFIAALAIFRRGVPIFAGEK